MARSRCPSSAVLLPLWAVLWSSAAVAAPPPVAPAYLVRDIGTQTRPSASSYPSAFVALGDAIYFLASPGNLNGRELWRTDGTPSGTVRVVNLVSEEVWEFRPDHLTALRDGLVFTLGRHGTGVELWAQRRHRGGDPAAEGPTPGTGRAPPCRSRRRRGSPRSSRPTRTTRARAVAQRRHRGRHHRVADLTSARRLVGAGADGVGERLYFTTYPHRPRTRALGERRQPRRTPPASKGCRRRRSACPLPARADGVGDALFFVAQDAEAGDEPWRVDAAGLAVRVDGRRSRAGRIVAARVRRPRRRALLPRASSRRSRSLVHGWNSAEGTRGIATGAGPSGESDLVRRPALLQRARAVSALGGASGPRSLAQRRHARRARCALASLHGDDAGRSVGIGCSTFDDTRSSTSTEDC